jgi:hypothetical protein
MLRRDLRVGPREPSARRERFPHRNLLRPGDDKRFDDALAALQRGAEVTLLEGLPRGRTLSESETASKLTFVSNGQVFYQRPLPLTELETEAVRIGIGEHALYSRREPGVYKLCGGFHADYALSWISRDGPCEMHFCFGCSEVDLFTPDEKVELDMRGGSTEARRGALGKLLTPHFAQRPDHF